MEFVFERPPDFVDLDTVIGQQYPVESCDFTISYGPIDSEDMRAKIAAKNDDMIARNPCISNKLTKTKHNASLKELETCMLDNYLKIHAYFRFHSIRATCHIITGVMTAFLSEKLVKNMDAWIEGVCNDNSVKCVSILECYLKPEEYTFSVVKEIVGTKTIKNDIYGLILDAFTKTVIFFPENYKNIVPQIIGWIATPFDQNRWTTNVRDAHQILNAETPTTETGMLDAGGAVASFIGNLVATGSKKPPVPPKKCAAKRPATPSRSNISMYDDMT